MLADRFLSAAALGIEPIERDSLIVVLRGAESGQVIDSKFQMRGFRSDCGTIFCLCGLAHEISKGEAFPELRNEVPLRALVERIPRTAADLFAMRHEKSDLYLLGHIYRDARIRHAAVALRSYLTSGKPYWDEALNSDQPSTDERIAA